MNEIKDAVMSLSLQGKNCAEIVMMLSLEMRGMNDDFLIKSMAGLAQGQFRQKDCGTLTSACCVIASYFAEEETLSSDAKKMIGAFGDWFEETFSSSRCDIILENSGQDMYMFCPTLLTRSIEKMIDILEENNIDPYA